MKNKKIILWAIIALILANCTLADVVINQVLYDPISTESGGEAIELYNNGNDDIDISSWVIATEASINDAVIPANTIICSNCYYLIADRGWNNSKDNASWPEADLEETLTLYNTNSGIALIFNETIIDAVGWGNPDEITDGLFEGNPTDGASEGKSLLRMHNTNDNKFDFEESVPFFRSSSDIGTGSDTAEIDIQFDIANSSTAGDNPENSISIDYVNLSKGKISPVPGGAAIITVNVQVTGQPIDNVTATLSGITAVLNKIETVNSTTAVFSVQFSLDYYLPPGDYSILIEANSGTEKDSISITFEYLALVAVEVIPPDINFGDIAPGEEHFSDIKVKNIGNTVVDIGLKTTIESANIYYSFDSTNFNKIPSNTVISDINLVYGKDKETTIKLKLAAPEDIKSGSYSGKIEITAVGSNN